MKPLKDFCIFVPATDRIDDHAAREFVIAQGPAKWSGLYDYEVRQLPVIRVAFTPAPPDRGIYVGQVSEQGAS
jgi:hypothetical protein